MTQYTERVRDILETDCGHTLQELVPKLKAEEVKELMSLVSGKSEAPLLHRQRAVFVLGRLGKTEALANILKAIPELDENGRVAAADALGRLGGGKARGALVKLSSDPDAQVRKFAARALARVGDKAAVECLQAMAEDDRQDWVREAARKQLERAR